jgi:hypothetical protein
MATTELVEKVAAERVGLMDCAQWSGARHADYVDASVLMKTVTSH